MYTWALATVPVGLPVHGNLIKPRSDMSRSVCHTMYQGCIQKIKEGGGQSEFFLLFRMDDDELTK